MPLESPWLTIREGATYGKVSARTLYTACEAGQLRHARVGGRRAIRLRAEWIDTWLTESAPREWPPRKQSA